jgi:hypothetical protein
MEFAYTSTHLSRILHSRTDAPLPHLSLDLMLQYQNQRDVISEKDGCGGVASKSMQDA